MKTVGNPSEKDYWENRVLKAPNEKDMLFLDSRREEFWARVRKQLDQWKLLEVVDVCCGYGQFSNIFLPNNYTGFDFSEEMLKLAKQKNPDKRFTQGDIKELVLDKNYDVVFEVNSLHSLGMTPEQFFEKFKNNGKVVACLEADLFTIYHQYGK